MPPVAAFIAAVALAAPPIAVEVRPIPFTAYTLANGLQVILHRDPRLPIVAVSVWYCVGSLHEQVGRSGFAHLFEHMMFQGSAHVPKDRFIPTLAERGATDVNGQTTYDWTRYYETVPAQELELALWLEADRMGFLLASLDQAELDNQKDVVQNERRLKVADREYGRVDELIARNLFPKPHPYYGNVIGAPEDIAAATLDDVRDFYRRYYTPANATITLAGDLDPQNAKALIDKYFGTLKGAPKPPGVDPPWPELKESRVIDAWEPIARQPRISFAWLGPKGFDPGTAELNVLAEILDENHFGLLGGHLASYGVKVDSVRASFAEHRAGSVFRLDVVVRPKTKLEDVLQPIDTLLELLRRVEIDELIDRAVQREELEIAFALQRLGGAHGRAEVLQTYRHYFGDPGKLAWDLARTRRVTAAGIKEAVRKFLGPARIVVYAEPSAGRIPRKTQ